MQGVVVRGRVQGVVKMHDEGTLVVGLELYLCVRPPCLGSDPRIRGRDLGTLVCGRASAMGPAALLGALTLVRASAPAARTLVRGRIRAMRPAALPVALALVRAAAPATRGPQEVSLSSQCLLRKYAWRSPSVVVVSCGAPM